MSGGDEGTRTLDGDSVTIQADPSPEANPPERELRAGTAIGRFVVSGIIGRGAMGVVVRAYDPDLDRHVAIKILRAEAIGHETEAARARLVREARAMAKIAHPNVVPVLEVGLDEGHVFVAMECVEGGTLKDWLRTKPPQAAVLDAFVQAARGLVAAHRAGLVHRDFKPENVLRGDDGRVRVSDFGLVGVGELAASKDAAPSGDETLTRTGAVMGTPAYMAPEQHRGDKVDARADQFAFCVSLYEALYSQRPFPGDDLPSLAAAVTGGKVRDPPEHTDVPAWLRRVLLRGLSLDPDARYPSMEALVTDLRLTPVRRKKRRVGWAVALAVIGTATVAVSWRSVARSRACQDAGQAIGAVWNDDRKQAVAAAFEATGRADAQERSGRVGDLLDRYAERWRTASQNACEAAKVEQTQSERILELRNRCLGQRRSAMAALVDRLAEADERTVAYADSAVRSLPPLSPCADGARLETLAVWPEDPDTRARIEKLYAKLDEVHAAKATGDSRGAVDIATEALGLARQIDFPPALAKALASLGDVQSTVGSSKEARETLREAVVVAADAEVPETEADAWLSLAYTAGAVDKKYDEALAAVLAAEAAHRRGPDDPYRSARLEGTLGVIRRGQGEYDLAEEHYLAAIERWEEAFGQDHPYVLTSVLNYGMLLREQARYDEAREVLERALALAEDSYGATHRKVALALSTLGAIAFEQSRYADAEALHRRALSVYEVTDGPRSVRAGMAHNNVADALRKQGRYDEAQDRIEEALTIMVERFGQTHANTAQVRAHLGDNLTHRGRYDEAETQYRKAIETLAETVGSEHQLVAQVRAKLGILLETTGRFDEAEREHRSALASFEQHFGGEDPRVGQQYNNLSALMQSKGDFEQARHHAKRALEIWTGAYGDDNLRVAIAINNLASIDAGQGKHAAACKGFTEALSRMRTLQAGADMLSHAQTGLGRCLTAQGRPDEAIGPLRRALQARVDAGVEPQEQGETAFALAQASWKAGHDNDGRRYGRQALEAYEASGSAYADEAEEVEQWLRKRGSASASMNP